MAYVNAELTIENKSFTGENLPFGPSTPGSPDYPTVFDSPIYFEFSYEMTWIYGTHFCKREVECSGYWTGYTSGSAKYPYMAVKSDGQTTNQWGVITSADDATYAGVVYTLKNYEDGEQQGTTYTQNNPSYSNLRNSDTNFNTDAEIHIISSTLPIILYDQYEEGADEYYVAENGQDTTWPNTSEEYNITMILNQEEDPEPLEETTWQTIENKWSQQKWTKYNFTQLTPDYYRNVRFSVTPGSGRLGFYMINGIVNDTLRAGFKYNCTFDAIEVSTDGNNYAPAVSFPYSWFYRPRIDETGTFSCGSLYKGYLPIFATEAQLDDYLSGTLSIKEALNWGQISEHYDPTNPSGGDDPKTNFGEVGASGIFSQQYMLTKARIQEIANKFFDTADTSLMDDIKKGLQMYGANPIDGIQGLMYFPIDLKTVFTNYDNSGTSINLGGYTMTLSGNTYRIINPNGKKSLGTITINRTWNNWMDFEPYSKLFVELPYIGYYQLDLKKYYGKHTEVIYFIDSRSGGCCACLVADGHLEDRFNGQMGVSQSITLTDYSRFANSQINTLLGGGGQAVQNAGGTINAMGQLASSGAGAGAIGAGVAAGAAGIGVMAGITTAKTLYGLSQNNSMSYNTTKGGSTSMINMYLPQTVTFTFEVFEPDIPSNFYQLNGYPSNKAGVVGDFTGFFQAESVKLSVPGATEREKAEIEQLLYSGIYI